MAIYTEIHDFQQYNIPDEQKMAIIQVQPAADISYEKYLTGLVAQALWEHQCSWIILPKGSCTESLDRTIVKLVQQQDHDVIVIYGTTAGQGPEHSAILIKRGKQVKCYFQPSLTTNDSGNQCRHIFVNTGIGDFAVLPADHDLNSEQLKYFSAWVDVLVVTARNKETLLFDQILQDYCATAYNIVAYSNQSVITEYDEEDKLQILGGESGFYIPYQNFSQRKIKIIPTGKQDISICPLQISLLEQGRAGHAIPYPDSSSPTLASATYLIAPHYNAKPRTEEHWRNLLSKQEALQKPSIILEQWQVMSKEPNKWKYMAKVRETTIMDFPCVLGRSSRSQIALENSKVSSQHAELIQSNGEYCIRDLSSTGGTFFLDKKRICLPVDKEVELNSGEYFWLALDHCFCIRFQEKGTAMLEFWEDYRKVWETIVTEFPTILGTGAHKIKIPHRQGIMPSHAKLIRRDEKFFLQALSESGTFVWPHRPYVKLKNKLPPLDPQAVKDGELFCLSQEVFFRVIIPKEHTAIGRHIYTAEN